jgi:outer membrane immunogenic protein
MRCLSLAIIAGVSTIAFTQLASAADLPRKAPPAPPPAPVFSWTGFYAGGNVGVAWSRSNVNYAPNDALSEEIFFNAPFFAPPPSASVRDSSLIGGLQLGYNWQFAPAWLIGAEADFDWSGLKGSAATSGPFFPPSTFTNSVEQRVEWFGTVRGRLGYLPLPNLMAFVTGGFAFGRIEQSATYTTVATVTGFNAPFFAFCIGGGGPCYAGSSKGTEIGWTIGGGIEYALWQNWTIRGEYLHVSLGSKSVTETAVSVAAGTIPSSFNANFGRTNLDIARFALNYQFH